MPIPETNLKILATSPVIALAASVVMWALLYVLLMPAVAAQGWMVGIGGGLCILGAGVVAGRFAGSSWAGGALVGLTITAVNLLILGSLLGGEQPGEVLFDAAWWMAGFLVAAVILAAVGAGLTRGAEAPWSQRQWTVALAVVTAASTFLLLVAGGIVTGLEAGLSIRGWLTANDYPLILFPLRHMQSDSGVFAEHAHRLWGLLVGLCAISLVVRLFRVGAPRPLALLAVAVLLAVIVQGVMGGTRVTEESLTLAIIHGVFGQVVFAMMVAAAVLIHGARPAEGEVADRDRKATRFLVGLLLVQLAVGSMYRHGNAAPDVPAAMSHGALGGHILLAAVVTVVAILAAGRCASGTQCRTLRWFGAAVLVLIPIQVLLGVGAVTLILVRGDREAIPLAEILITTAHQATGALLLGSATGLAVMTRERSIDS